MACINPLHHPLHHPRNPYCVEDPDKARGQLVQTALSYQASAMWGDEHPGVAHMAAELEMKEEILDKAARAYLLVQLAELGLEDAAHSWAATYVDRVHPWDGQDPEPSDRAAAYNAASEAYLAGRLEALTG